MKQTDEVVLRELTHGNEQNWTLYIAISEWLSSTDSRKLFKQRKEYLYELIDNEMMQGVYVEKGRKIAAAKNKK